MLILTRKPVQRIFIGDDIIVTVLRVQGDYVRIGIDAPKDIKIMRDNMHPIDDSENKETNDESIAHLFRTQT